MSVPKSHPRYESLRIRDLIVHGVKIGITSQHGLIAHGRGEAFDYLLGEKTHPFAKKAIEAAATMLLSAKHPVISVNGNTAALIPNELVKLSKILNCPLEVNLFHASKKREQLIANWLIKHGAELVLIPEATLRKGGTLTKVPPWRMPGIASQRKYVNPEGIAKADVVFVPLEDGDRAEALVKAGKKVITADLNPLSRTAKAAAITIVDNITRALPLLFSRTVLMSGTDLMSRTVLVTNNQYSNPKTLHQAEKSLRRLSP